MRKPEPVYVPFRGREVRVGHDDPYMPTAGRLRAIASLASDVDGLRRALETTVGERYDIEVPDDGSEIMLRRSSTGR